MKKIPFRGIAVACMAQALLVVARCLVTVGKAKYFGYAWKPKLQEDPWVVVGIVAAILAVGAVAGWIVQERLLRSQTQENEA